MNRGGSLLVLASIALLGGCATQAQLRSTAPGASLQGTSTDQVATAATGAAPAATAPPSPTAVLSLTASPPAASAAPVPASAAPQNAQPTAQKDAIDTHGMSAVVIHGKKVFCELEIPVGSHIPHKTCWTEAQLKEKQQAAQRMMMELDRRSAAGKQIPLECGAISGQAQPGC